MFTFYCENGVGAMMSVYCDYFSGGYSPCCNPVITCLLQTELEVARLSTDGNLEDLKFPQNMGHGSSIQLSANTLKQNGRNGKCNVVLLYVSFELVNALYYSYIEKQFVKS